MDILTCMCAHKIGVQCKFSVSELDLNLLGPALLLSTRISLRHTHKKKKPEDTIPRSICSSLEVNKLTS